LEDFKMKKLNYFALLIGIMIFTVSIYAVDVRWVTSITVSPDPLTTGVPGTAQASFRVNGAGGIDNLRVTGGVVGGDMMFDRTWAHIDDGATRTASFSGTPGDPGVFTIYFQIDPDSTSPDSDRTNNRIELSITVVAGLQPNLVNIVPGPTWWPAIFSAGEVVNVHYMIGNVGDGDAREFLVGLRVDGAMVAQNPHAALAAHTPFVEGDFSWTVRCGARVELVVDSGTDVSESNEADNTVGIPGLSTCAPAPVLPNLTVEKLKLDSGSWIVSEHAAVYYKGKIWSRDNSSTNVKVRAGIVGGAVLYENTFPIIIKDDGRFIEFKANLPKGIRTLYIEVDPDNTVAESNERDNRATSKFQVVGKEGPMIAPATNTLTPRK
jgi:subtilase family serine protease